jgi:hypothetical protein
MDQETTNGLQAFVAIARETFVEHLHSVVLFGSGAEDRLRAVSDLNLILVLTAYQLERAAAFGKQSAPQRVALRIQCMFILQSEVEEASRVFAVKFSDISRRHRVLWGEDVFGKLEISRKARIFDVREGLLNLELRLRAQWVSHAAFPDQLRHAAAEFAGGLRACASELLALEKTPAASPHEALVIIAGEPLADLSSARMGAGLDVASSEQLFRRLMQLAGSMRERAGRLA